MFDLQPFSARRNVHEGEGSEQSKGEQFLFQVLNTPPTPTAEVGRMEHSSFQSLFQVIVCRAFLGRNSGLGRAALLSL